MGCARETGANFPSIGPRAITSGARPWPIDGMTTTLMTSIAARAATATVRIVATTPHPGARVAMTSRAPGNSIPKSGSARARTGIRTGATASVRPGRAQELYGGVGERRQDEGYAFDFARHERAMMTRLADTGVTCVSGGAGRAITVRWSALLVPSVPQRQSRPLCRVPGPDAGHPGGSFRGHGPKDYTRSDDRIRDDVCDRLSDAGHIDARGISVEVSGGEVTLGGYVPSRQAKRAAEDAIEDCSGVCNVQNNLRVRDGDADQGQETKPTIGSDRMKSRGKAG